MLTIKDLYKLPAQKGRDIGIEIEMEGRNLAIAGSVYWTLHNDGSLRPNPESIEYVLTRPVPYKAARLALQELTTLHTKYGAKLNPSDRCGVHIHVNCQDLTIMQTLCFIITYLILEEPMVKWCGEEREGNLFALRAKDAEGIITLLVQAAQDEDFRCFSSEMRYSSINVASLLKYGSLEFRALNTPKDFSIIETWIDMLMRIKNYALAYKHPRDIIETISASGFSKFPSNVLGDMAELIQCKGYAVMISEGVRRVQEIAYADLLVNKKKEKEKPVATNQFDMPLAADLEAVYNRYNYALNTIQATPAPRPGRRYGQVEPAPVPQEARPATRGEHWRVVHDEITNTIRWEREEES